MRRIAALLTLACLLPAAAADARKPGSRTVVNKGVKATLSWSKGMSFLGDDAKITITRDGVRLVDHRRLAPLCDTCGSIALPRQSLRVRDVDADGVPEVIVDMFSGGAHCCWDTVVFVPKDGTYKARLAQWGNASYELKDLDGGGLKEFVTGDDRFDSAFTSHAASYRPPLVYQLIGQKFRDVTRSFPQLMIDDLGEIDKLMPDARKMGDVKGLVAARMADLALLGRSSEIEPYLAQGRKRGDFDGAYQAALLKFLRKSGYLPR